MGKRKLEIIQNFDLSYSIIEILHNKWNIVAGPYLNKEEAKVDLRNLIYESRHNI
jgi:hypothetical protein